MFCNKCGKQIDDDSTFCVFCGAKCDGDESVKNDSDVTEQIVRGDKGVTVSLDGMNNRDRGVTVSLDGMNNRDKEVTVALDEMNIRDNEITVAQYQTDNSSNEAFNELNGKKTKKTKVKKEKKAADEEKESSVVVSVLLVIIAILIGLIAVLFASIAIISYVRKHSGDKTQVVSDNEHPSSEEEVVVSEYCNYTIGVYGANFDNDEDGAIIGATVKLIPGYDNISGEATFAASTDGNGKCSFSDVPAGQYTLLVNGSGYFSESENIFIGDNGSMKKYVVPVPGDDAVIVRVEWKGDYDLDLCFFNATSYEYISIGNPMDRQNSFLYADNDGKKYEIIYLRKFSSSTVRSVYVVDPNAAKNESSSKMESDGVRIDAFDSNGLIYSKKADESKSEPIWYIGYIFEGNFYDDDAAYVAKAIDNYSWALSVKETPVERLTDRIQELNSATGNGYEIDVFADNYQPGTRDQSLTWDSEEFYAMEEHHDSTKYYDKNACSLKKMELKNAKTGNLIDYDIYLNPVTMKPNKIVSIEFTSNGIEVYEYYYSNDGKVNFVFKYNTDNYVSSYATLDKSGDRFQFNSDNMTIWRNVNQGNTIQFVNGDNEAERLKGKGWGANTIKKYNTLTADQKATFDMYENMIIDAAYNTYNAAVNMSGISKVQGFVMDDSYNPVAYADVVIYGDGFDEILYSTKTDGNGYYCIYVPAEEYKYNIKVSVEATGAVFYSSCEIYDIEMTGDKIAEYNETVTLIYMPDATELPVSVYIGDAFKSTDANNVRIGNANIAIRKGINNRHGEVIKEYSTDAYGYVEMYLEQGVYTMEAYADGYQSMYYTIVSNPNESNVYEFYAAQNLNEGEFAVVLSWGDKPSDLDSHMFVTRYTDKENKSHIWFGGKYDQFGNMLDVDDTDSYGPETITIRNFSYTDYYKYCVVDYSDAASGYTSSTAMSYSNATVSVYSSKGLVAVYHVPVGRAGVIWEVFEIRNGVVTPIQRYYDNIIDNEWWAHE